MFHVKRLQTEETEINLFIDISEVQQVAIASLLPYILVQSPTRTRLERKKMISFFYLTTAGCRTMA